MDQRPGGGRGAEMTSQRFPGRLRVRGPVWKKGFVDKQPGSIPGTVDQDGTSWTWFSWILQLTRGSKRLCQLMLDTCLHLARLSIRGSVGFVRAEKKKIYRFKWNEGVLWTSAACCCYRLRQ